MDVLDSSHSRIQLDPLLAACKQQIALN